jgi:hypothetical protein
MGWRFCHSAVTSEDHTEVLAEEATKLMLVIVGLLVIFFAVMLRHLSTYGRRGRGWAGLLETTRPPLAANLKPAPATGHDSLPPEL